MAVPTISIFHGSNDRYGASRVLLDDVTILAGLGHELTVFLPDDGPLTEALERLGCSVEIGPLDVLRRVNGPRVPAIPVRLPKAARSSDIIVVWTLALLPYAIAGRLARKRVVVSVHEILPGGFGRGLAIAARVLGHDLVVNSRSTMDWLLNRPLGEARHDVELMYPVAPVYEPVPFPAPSGSVRLFLAGRVNGHKGHADAVVALRAARARGADVTLELAGGVYPGQEEHLVRLLEEIDLTGGSASFVGEVDDTKPFIANCDVVLVPTTRPEPFGIVALEGWAAGRRVLGSDRGGLAEALSLVDGHQFACGSVEELTEWMIRLANEPELRTAPRATARAADVCSLAMRRASWIRILDRDRGNRPAELVKRVKND